MKRLLIGLLTLGSVSAFAGADGEIIQVPDSCYKAAKSEAFQYADSLYSNVHAKTPFYAESYKKGIIVPVFISSSDLDFSARVNVPVRPLLNGGCEVGKAYGLYTKIVP